MGEGVGGLGAIGVSFKYQPKTAADLSHIDGLATEGCKVSFSHSF